MGLGGSTLLPAPDERLLKSIKMLDLSNTDLAKVRHHNDEQHAQHGDVLVPGEGAETA